MDWLEVGIVFAVTGTGREAESADSATGNISEDIAVLVRKHHHIQSLWGGDHTPCQVIYEKFLVTQAGVGTNRLLYDGTETTIRAW